MPIPTPKDNEMKEEFIERCMSDEVMQEYDDKQRLAICESQINNEKNKDMEKDKRHVKEIIEDSETITIVYEKDERFEGIKVKKDDTPDEGEEETIEENDSHLEEEEEEEENSKGVWRNKDAVEKRFFETRIKTDGKKNTIVGHAAVFGRLSEDLGNFREEIAPNAFDGVLKNDVRAYFNHNPDLILGRVSANTLRIRKTKKGLQYSLDLPNTTAGRDMLENLKNGNVNQSSFAFQVEKDSWRSDDDLGEIRTIEKVKRLYDVSPVSLPAYPDSNDLQVATRNFYIYKDKQKMQDERQYELKRSLLNLRIQIKKRKIS